jgi:hypothetical protein
VLSKTGGTSEFCSHKPLALEFNKSRIDTFMELFLACDGTNIDDVYIFLYWNLHIAFCNVTFFGPLKVQHS